MRREDRPPVPPVPSPAGLVGLYGTMIFGVATCADHHTWVWLSLLVCVCLLVGDVLYGGRRS